MKLRFEPKVDLTPALRALNLYSVDNAPLTMYILFFRVLCLGSLIMPPNSQGIFFRMSHAGTFPVL